VRVDIAREGSALVLSVRDTGQGIAPDFLPFVFDRFRQADASASRHHYGLGLGLAIVRTIVEMHGGTVRAESDGPGRGSRFAIALPLEDVPPLPPDSDHPCADRSPLAPPEAETSFQGKLGGARVLVVDDHPDAREVVRLILAEQGADVRIAAGAEEALALIADARVDVLLADLGMPGVDGFELIRRVRQRDEALGCHTPAAALTAFARAEDRERALSAGFQEHVTKPVCATSLVASVAKLMHGL
jgi:CheY-like chemotaxis protein